MVVAVKVAENGWKYYLGGSRRMKECSGRRMMLTGGGNKTERK